LTIYDKKEAISLYIESMEKDKEEIEQPKNFFIGTVEIPFSHISST